VLRFALPSALVALVALLTACQPKPREKAATPHGDTCGTPPPYNPERSKEWNALRAQMDCAKLEEPGEPKPR
jgi:hypothetical protein